MLALRRLTFQLSDEADYSLAQVRFHYFNYCAASVLTSVYFMTVGGRPEIFITLQVILLGDGLIMVLVILYKGPCAAECNLNTEEARAKMQKLEEKVLAMVDNQITTDMQKS